MSEITLGKSECFLASGPDVPEKASVSPTGLYRPHSWPYTGPAQTRSGMVTTQEGLYGMLHARLVTPFPRQGIAPNEQEAKEIHATCMLAKNYLVKCEEIVPAHLPMYVEGLL
ncbi:hypothetical protein HOY82DRAFT_597508 [Tuber indicum]|nr:hypothetical protein HOY82DRAFT_597508 [Tuber indicum]